MPATDIKGFQVLPVKLPGCKSTHYLFARKHDAKNQGSLADRLLFVFNLPIETSRSTVKKYFTQIAAGATVELFILSALTELDEDVWVDLTKLTSEFEYQEKLSEAAVAEKLPKNCGVVVFVDKASFQLAFSLVKKLSAEGRSTSWPMSALGTSFLLAKARLRVLDNAALGESVTAALADFNRAEKETEDELRKLREAVDEDGFTLVVGRNMKTKTDMMGQQRIAATVAPEKASGKLREKEKDDFYRFQFREKKKSEINDLLLKFKQDQERVRLMREKKRFRPY